MVCSSQSKTPLHTELNYKKLKTVFTSFASVKVFYTPPEYITQKALTKQNV